MRFLTFADLDRVSRQFSEALNERKKTAEAGIRMAPMDADFDIFLSHSYSDAQIDGSRLSAVKALLESQGHIVYTDWEVDPYLDRKNVTARACRIIRHRMDHSASLIFVTSKNSSTSTWMPWELGYMDGAKDRACVLPVLEQGEDSFKGQEYLGIYPWLTYAKSTTDGEKKFWVHETNTRYIVLEGWMRGLKPQEH